MGDATIETMLAAAARAEVAVAARGALVEARRAADARGLVDVSIARVPTPVGELLVAVTDEGLLRVAFPEEEGVLDDLAARVSPRVVESARAVPWARAFERYFAGRLDVLDDLPVDWRLCTSFGRAVLEEARRVRPGDTVSYATLASRLGRPGAARAVGNALARNPVPLAAPCHRVVPARGGVGNYAGGADRKRSLLEHEAAA